MSEIVPGDWVNVVLSVAVGAAVVAVWVAVLAFRRQAARDEAWATVNILVGAAEQMLAEYTGSAKLDWVMGQLEERFPALDANLIRSMVEAAVGQMNRAQGRAE
jgi:hypothetical protein